MAVATTVQETPWVVLYALGKEILLAPFGRNIPTEGIVVGIVTKSVFHPSVLREMIIRLSDFPQSVVEQALLAARDALSTAPC